MKKLLKLIGKEIKSFRKGHPRFSTNRYIRFLYNEILFSFIQYANNKRKFTEALTKTSFITNGYKVNYLRKRWKK